MQSTGYNASAAAFGTLCPFSSDAAGVSVSRAPPSYLSDLHSCSHRPLSAATAPLPEAPLGYPRGKAAASPLPPPPAGYPRVGGACRHTPTPTPPSAGLVSPAAYPLSGVALTGTAPPLPVALSPQTTEIVVEDASQPSWGAAVPRPLPLPVAATGMHSAVAAAAAAAASHLDASTNHLVQTLLQRNRDLEQQLQARQDLSWQRGSAAGPPSQAPGPRTGVPTPAPPASAATYASVMPDSAALTTPTEAGFLRYNPGAPSDPARRYAALTTAAAPRDRSPTRAERQPSTVHRLPSTASSAATEPATPLSYDADGLGSGRRQRGRERAPLPTPQVAPETPVRTPSSYHGRVPALQMPSPRGHSIGSPVLLEEDGEGKRRAKKEKKEKKERKHKKEKKEKKRHRSSSRRRTRSGRDAERRV